MKFLNHTQEEEYEKAMKRKYKAIAFDVDGTLTKLARWHIPWSLLETIAKIPQNIPLAICTGREFSHAKQRAVHIASASPHSDDDLKRWYLFCENGSVAYKFSQKDNDFKKIFEINWPSELISKDVLQAFIKDKFGMHVIVHFHEHNLVVYYNRWLYLFPKLVRRLSRKMAKKIEALIKELGQTDKFKVLDSGIGNIVMPHESGKGKAMKFWAKELGISVNDILVIGDQGGPGENDEEFLSGEFGTSFTVGHQTENVYPLPVLNNRGQKMLGPEGTESLVSQLNF